MQCLYEILTHILNARVDALERILTNLAAELSEMGALNPSRSIVRSLPMSQAYRAPGVRVYIARNRSHRYHHHLPIPCLFVSFPLPSWYSQRFC